MIKVKKSANLAFGPSQRLGGSAALAPREPKSLGSKAKLKSRKEDDWESTSTSSPVGGSGAGGNMSMSNSPITLDLEPLLTGITPLIEQTYFHRLYRDMYYHDPVAGSAVDLISTLPFSEFTLGGVSDKKILDKYQETLERLSLRTLLPEISVDYLVLGSHISSLLYNKDRRQFTDIMPHAVENLTFEQLPFYSQDPLINVKFNKTVQDVLQKDTPRIRRIRQQIGDAVLSKIAEGSLELDPLTTIYIPRKTFSTTDMGTSYFRRILPIYLIEKNLFRGTMVESARRQRGILHLTLGDGDEWIPTVADLEFATDLFHNADSDPLGAVIATRLGVSVEELRQGGDFWKVTDFSDSVLPHKLRALGISEGFLSGEANYNTADTSLTVFIEMMRAFRDMLTRKLFYDKLFPLIAVLNGYTLNSKGKVVINESLMRQMGTEELQYNLNDGSKLLIPTVHWTKQLKPEGDSQYMEMLGQLSEKGIPVPMRVLAAAGGLNLDELLRQQEDDLDARKRVKEYQDKLAELAPKIAEGDEGDEDTAEASAALIALASEDPSGRIRSAVQAKGGKVALLNREFKGDGLIRGKSKTGKDKFIHNQRAANEKVNRLIESAMRRAHRRGALNGGVTPD